MEVFMCRFHGNITREEADQLLSNGGDGSYLVRKSERAADAYTLAIRYNSDKQVTCYTHLFLSYIYLILTFYISWFFYNLGCWVAPVLMFKRHPFSQINVFFSIIHSNHKKVQCTFNSNDVLIFPILCTFKN